MSKLNEMRFLPLVFGIITTLFLFTPHSNASDPTTQNRKKMLVLQSYDSELPWVKTTTQNIREAVKQFENFKFSLNIEYLDLAKELTPTYRIKMMELIRLKYLDNPPDVLVCFDTLSAYFCIELQSDVFKDIPVVFSIAKTTYNLLKNSIPERSAVVTNEVDHEGTLKLALDLFPKTQHVFVIGGQTKGSRISEDKLRRVRNRYNDHIRFHFLSHLSYDTILQTVANLPDNSIIFHLVFFADISGKKYVPVRVINEVSEKANAPIFSLYEPHIGYGTLGGRLIKALSISSEAVKLAAALLENPLKASGRRIETSGTPIFDWRQLQRWNIKETMLPKGSDIRYKKHTFFEEHRNKILLFASLFFLQILLIFFLVVNLIRRKRTEDNLIKSETRHRSILKAAINGFFMTDLAGNFIDVNPAFCRMTGYDENELLTMDISDIEVNEDIDQIQNRLSEIVQKEQVRFETRYRCRNGTILNVEVSSQFHTNQEAHLFAFVRDLTEKKRVQTALQQSQKMDAIGTLAGGIAHDFNNILGAIIGFADLARLSTGNNVKFEHYLSQILRASERAKSLVQQILLFSRKSENKKTPLKLEPMVKEVIKFLRATLPPEIDIKTSFSDSTGMVQADPTQIHQVLMNLCTNAFHAMHGEGGTLSVSVEEVQLDENSLVFLPDLAPAKYILLKVSDTGCGISDENMNQIFDPFFTTKMQGEGTGLGLSVVHGIVKNNGGAIKVYSEPKKGSTFNVFLPVITANESNESVSESKLPTGIETILFVDDESDLVEIGQQRLEELGYTVIGFSDSTKAWAAFKSNPEQYDIIVTDKNMPGMSGIQLSEKILAIRPDTPIILLSGFHDSVSYKQSREIGIATMIDKPILTDELAVSIRRALEKKQINHNTYMQL